MADDDQLKLEAPDEELLLEAEYDEELEKAKRQTEPSLQPVAPTESRTEAKTTHIPVESPKVVNTPGLLVLQWLTYAFWGWTIVALTWLTAVSIDFFVNKPTTSYDGGASSVAYPLAAVVVLLLISLACDLFYSRREPVHKTGAAMVIMIIHAVLFALCGIGALIVAVFAVVSWFVGDSTGNSPLSALLTGLIVALVYGATLLRVIRPLKLKHYAGLYWTFMALTMVVVTTLGITGPVMYQRTVRNDRLIEQGLTSVSDAINQSARNNKTLPSSLQAIRDNVDSTTGKQIIDQNLVEYTPGKQVEATVTQGSSDGSTVADKVTNVSAPVFEYELCVTFKAARSSSYSTVESTTRNTSPNTYIHKAGRNCYPLQTEYSYRNDYNY